MAIGPDSGRSLARIAYVVISQVTLPGGPMYAERGLRFCGCETPRGSRKEAFYGNTAGANVSVLIHSNREDGAPDRLASELTDINPPIDRRPAIGLGCRAGRQRPL